MPLLRTILLASLATALSSALDAQQQSVEQITDPPGVPTLTVFTRIVVLDFLVTDKKSNVVLDRPHDDFIIIEDGLPQAIRSFESPS